MSRFRKMLTDDWYFGHKAYITAYCGEEFRPKLPSQRTALNKIELNQGSPEEAKDDYTQPIHGEMARWSALLKKNKVSVETHAPTGGHSFAFVTGQIPSLVNWFRWQTN